MGCCPPKPKVKRERAKSKVRTSPDSRKTAAQPGSAEAKKARAAQRKAAKEAAAPAEKA